jgi:hypothetical protein
MTSFKEQIARDAAVKRVKDIKDFYNHLTMFLLVNSILAILIYYFVGSIWYFLWFGAGGWAIGVIIHATIVFSWNPFLGKDWEQRKIKQLLEEDE